MDTTLMPARQGQICKIVSEVADFEPGEVYIVTEDPADFDPDENITIVGLKDLQRNVKNPELAERLAVQKKNLVVVGEDLTAYVQSWNQR